MKLFFKGFIFIFFVIFFFSFFIDPAIASTTNELFTAKIGYNSSWQNVSNILNSPDSQYATNASNALALTGTVNVPFNIPVASTINSVSIKIYQNSYGNSGSSNAITITSNGTSESCGASPSFLLNNTTQVITFNPTNCVNFSAIATVSKLNSGHFGWWITNSGTKNASFDAISMLVDYDPLVMPTLDISELNFSPGSVWGWPTATISAVKKDGLSDIISVSVGKGHSLALKKDGTVWAWGINDWGQLGIGTRSGTVVYPVGVKSPDGQGYLTDVKEVAVGEKYSMVLKKDGTVWVWGLNIDGIRGTGIGINDYSNALLLPAQVKANFGVPSDIIAIAAGDYHSLALKSDGKVFAWGNNSQGQVQTSCYFSTCGSLIHSPRQVFSDVKAITAGSHHSLAVKTNGTVWGWGKFSGGQLGSFNGDYSGQGSPVQITEISNVKSIYARNNTSLAISGDNKIYEWGSGRWPDNADPRQIPGLDGVGMISSGSYFTGYVGIALKNDGTVWIFDVQTLIVQQVSGFSNIGFVSGGSGVPNLAVVKMSDSTPTLTPTPTPKTPLIIIPGIGGSEFNSNETFLSEVRGCGISPVTFNYNAGDLVWLDPIRAAVSPCDEYLDVLKLKADGITPEYSQITLNGKLFGGAYGGAIKFFEDQGFELNKTLFIFPYDWRKDVSLTAPLLDQKINDIKIQTGDQKVDILAHSMGGLVARNYISDFSRAQNIRKLFTLGTPHLGSVDFLKNLRFGGCLTKQGWLADIANYSICFGIAPSEVKDIIQNMISGYELAPSQEYFDFYNGQNGNLFPYQNNGQSLSYDQIKSFLADLNYNTSLFSPAETFHNLDSSLINTNGVDVVNIAGSGLATLGQIREKSVKDFWGNVTQKKDGFTINGDKTVPLFSASLVDHSRDKSLLGNAKIFYTKQDHGGLIASGSALNLVKNILEENSYLPNGASAFPHRFSGTQVSVHSPVNINVYDSFNNHTGPIADGNLEANIPGSSYDTLGDAKFIFLPDDGNYKIKFEAIDQGSFDFKIRKYEDDTILQETLYKDIPLEISTKAETHLDTSSGTSPTIYLDENGDGIIDQNIDQSSNLTGDAVFDQISPKTNAQISGTLGNNNWYTSNVLVTLIAEDEASGSGILKTEYSLDNGQTVNIYTQPFVISTERINKLKFRSVDNAGNEEDPTETEIKIDKTAPEAQIFIDQNKQDLIVTGIDANQTTVVRSSNTLTRKKDDAFYLITDTAGNSLKLDVRERERVKLDRFRIYSIQYNSDPLIILASNYFNVTYNGKKQRANVREQNFEIKKEVGIRIQYDAKKNKSTVIVKENKKERIKEIKSGLVLLQLLTNKGQLTTTY